MKLDHCWSKIIFPHHWLCSPAYPQHFQFLSSSPLPLWGALQSGLAWRRESQTECQEQQSSSPAHTGSHSQQSDPLCSEKKKKNKKEILEKILIAELWCQPRSYGAHNLLRVCLVLNNISVLSFRERQDAHVIKGVCCLTESRNVCS